MSEIKCPMCGSTDVEYEDDNLDDLFAFEWADTFEFDYTHEYICNGCGRFFIQTWHFTAENMGCSEGD